MRFTDPLFFVLILFIPLYAWYKLKKPDKGAMKFSDVKGIKGIRPSLPLLFIHTPLALRCLAVLLIIISLARPQKGIEHSKMPVEGIDIVLAVDVSTSMLAEDFTLNGKRVNRLDALRPVIKKFIQNRYNDRIGMVVFAGMAYTQCPLTLDYGILLQFLDRIKIGMVEDGTAIGSAIAVCLNRLKDVRGRSKVMILLTDGRNNAGKIDPLTAADAAKAIGVKIYTIGAGTRGLAPYPVRDFFGNKVYQRVPVDINEDTLRRIASATGGMYFRADNTRALEEIYSRIDKMEKSKAEVKIYMEYKELFPYFLFPAMILFLSGVIIDNTFLRRIP